MNLLDYLDKPERLQNVYGHAVKSIQDRGPGRRERILVLYEHGDFQSVTLEGKQLSFEGPVPVIILKPKVKKKVRGYRKAVLFDDGALEAAPMYYPTKEAFEEHWKSETLIGEWQEVLYEIEED